MFETQHLVYTFSSAKIIPDQIHKLALAQPLPQIGPEDAHGIVKGIDVVDSHERNLMVYVTSCLQTSKEVVERKLSPVADVDPAVEMRFHHKIPAQVKCHVGLDHEGGKTLEL